MLESAIKPGTMAPSGARLERSQFAVEFQRSFRVLWLVAVGILRDRAHAEDAVQDAAIIALDKLDTFEPGTSFTAWMGQTVRNVSLNKLRKERRRRGLSLDDSARDLAPAGADRSVQSPILSIRGEVLSDQRHFDDQVMQALGMVGETARACLLLRTVEGLEYSEIARVLEIPEGTAMSHVHRARKLLREKLSAGAGDRGVGP